MPTYEAFWLNGWDVTEGTAGGRPGYRGVPQPPENWPKARGHKRKKERITFHDASPVVVQADSIEELLLLLDLI